MHHHYQKSLSYKLFTVFNYTLLTIIAVLCLLPLIHILAVSFSGSAAATANLVGLWPVDFTLDAYEKTIGNENFCVPFGIRFCVLYWEQSFPWESCYALPIRCPKATTPFAAGNSICGFLCLRCCSMAVSFRLIWW